MSIRVFDHVDGSKSVFVLLRGAASPFARLHNELDSLPDSEWIQGTFMQNAIPRLVRWHHTGGMGYRFAGRKWQSQEYTRELLLFQSHLSTLVHDWNSIPKTVQGVPLNVDALNSVLVNKYRGCKDSISFHADDEPEFGERPTIVSVSFGAPRKFVVKPMTDTKRKKQCEKRKANFVPTPSSWTHPPKMEYDLEHGDVLIMAGASQEFWEHGILKEEEDRTASRLQVRPGKKRLVQVQETSVRYNLTFRPYV